MIVIIQKKNVIDLTNKIKYSDTNSDNCYQFDNTYWLSDGDKYDGELKNGKKDGKGVYYYNNGERYEGDFKNDNMEGKGIMYYKNGTQMRNGIWHENEFICDVNNIQQQQNIAEQNRENIGNNNNLKNTNTLNIRQQQNIAEQNRAEINNNNYKLNNTTSLNENKGNILSLNQ